MYCTNKIIWIGKIFVEISSQTETCEICGCILEERKELQQTFPFALFINI